MFLGGIITLKKIHHRDNDHIGIYFKYTHKLKESIKSTGALYSKTLNCWYLPYDRSNFDLLIKRFPNSIQYESKLSTPRAVEKTTLTKVLTTKSDIKYKMTPYWQNRLEEFEIYLSQKRYAESTIKSYYQSMILFFEWYCKEEQPPLDIRTLNLYNHSQFIQKNRSRSIQNVWVSAIKLFIEKFEDIPISTKDIERPKKSNYLPNILSIDEVKRLISSYKNTKHRVLFLLIYSCGLRKSEVINLKIVHLDFDRNILRIKNSKGAKDRDIPIPKKLRNYLIKYIESFKPEVYLFNGSKLGKYSTSSIDKLVKRGARAIGLKKSITCHTLRHSYATHLMEQNINLRYIQEALGHKSSKTTEIYTRLSKESIAKLVSPLDFW